MTTAATFHIGQRVRTAFGGEMIIAAVRPDGQYVGQSGLAWSATDLQPLDDATAFTFQVDVSRTYRNKDGYEASGLRLNNSFVTETHTVDSFIQTVVKEGWPYTMVHVKRPPSETGAAARGVLTPKHTENFTSSQLLTFDDDSRLPGVVDFWRNEPFFSRYGLAFVESVNSEPGKAEKGHPTLLLDRPITDPALYRECLRAYHYAFPRLDPLTNVDRTIYNAQDARVHLIGAVCPFQEFEYAYLEPYRTMEREKSAAIASERERRRQEAEQAKADGRTTSHSLEEAYLTGYLHWLFEHVAAKRAGDNRNKSIYWAGRCIAGVETTEWAKPHLHLLADVEARIMSAATTNGYLIDHAHNDEGEVLRVFDLGRQASGEPLDAPAPLLSANGDRAAVASASALPVIIVSNRHLRELSNDAFGVLLTANDPPHVYQFGGQLARVTAADGRAGVQLLDPAMLRYRLSRVADFVTVKALRDGTQQQSWVAPSDRLIADILAYPEWPNMPALSGVVTAPVVSPAGQVRVEAGYDPATGLYYHARGNLKIGNIDPTPERVAWAVGLIQDDLLGDFPFKDAASRANAVALLILPFARPSIEGCTPLHILNAPTPGTGKTLAARVATLLFNPDGPAVMTASQDEDEWRKRITSLLSGGASHLLIDNIKGALVSGSLAAVLSTAQWTDRILGKSQTITLPNRAVWIATGNNIAVDTEMARRSVWIRLDSNAERPWTRNGFKHASLGQWTLENRSDLVTAAIVLIRHWFKSDCPPGRPTIGGFESWARVIGGILDTTGILGFMGNAEELYEQSDPTAAQWAAFIAEWWKQFQDVPIGVKELFPLADSEPAEGITGLGLMDTMLTGHTARARKVRLGNLLHGRLDTVVDGFKIQSAGTLRRASLYQLKQLGV